MAEMIREIRKAGRQYVLTGNIMDAGEGNKASREHFNALKLDRVLRDAKDNFRSQPLRIKDCRLSLMEILVVVNSNGLLLKDSEVSELFFGMTTLFQNREWQIRRLVYVLLNELPVKPSEAFIITASLLKDASDSVPAHRGKAMRRFAKILDTAIASQLDQQVKNTIVDRDPLISSSGLMYCRKLLETHPEIVKRWSPEILSAVAKHNGTAQSLALSLILEIKRGDKLAMQKQLLTYVEEKDNSLGLQAQVVLLQQCEQFLCRLSALNQEDATLESTLISFISANLYHTQDAASFQSCKSLVAYAVHRAQRNEPLTWNMENCMKTIMIFLANPNVVVRFGAIRALYTLSHSYPQILGPYVGEVEALLAETHPTLAILALSTLLNTGIEECIDRLMGSIILISNQVPDNFRLDIILAIQHLTKQYPQKHIVFLNYLASQVKEERTIQFKEILVHTIRGVAELVPESIPLALSILCDYIEDSEYEALTGMVMEVIVELAVKSGDPKEYIYVLQNRLVLENSNVRVSAIGAMYSMAKALPHLRCSITNLLDITLVDTDDGVRSMSFLYQHALEHDTDMLDISTADTDGEEDMTDDLISNVVSYVNTLDAAGELRSTAINLENLPTADAVTDDVASDSAVVRGVALKTLGAQHTEQVMTTLGSSQSDILAEIQPMTSVTLTGVSHQTAPEKLTEDEAEYLVSISKIFFTGTGAEDLVALEFHITNTLDNVDLRQVVPRIANAEVLGVLPIASLCQDESKIAYALMSIDTTEPVISCPVHFTFTCLESGSDGVKDEYGVEPVILSIKDKLIPTRLDKNTLAATWASMENEEHAKFEHRYAIPHITSIVECFREVAKATGLYYDEKELNRIKDQEKGVVTMSCQDLNGVVILAKIWMKSKETSGYVTRVIFRCHIAQEGLLDAVVAAFKGNLGISSA